MTDSPAPDERRIQFPDHEATAAGLIREAANRWGDRILVVLDDQRVAYQEVERRSAEMARSLLASGVVRGSRLGLLAPNSPDWVVAWLAATRIGAVTTLLSTYARPRELGWALGHSGVEVLLTANGYLGRHYPVELETAIPGLVGQRHGEIEVASHPDLTAVYVWNGTDRGWASTVEDLVADASGTTDTELAVAEAAVGPDDPMVIMYTSGSTAEPKGVIHGHGAVVRHPYNLLPFRDLVPGDVLYTPMPLFWVGGLTYTLVSAMHAGATVVFEERFEAGATLDLIEAERVTHVVGWPHMSRALTEHPSFPDRDLSAVRGGSLDALLPPHLRVGDPELRANSLGMTESLGPHSIELIGSALPENKRGSFGRAVPGIEHRIVEPSTGEEAPEVSGLRDRLLTMVKDGLDQGMNGDLPSALPGMMLQSPVAPPDTVLSGMTAKNGMDILKKLDTAHRLADFVASTLLRNPLERQVVLESLDIKTRLVNVSHFLSMEIERNNMGPEGYS